MNRTKKKAMHALAVDMRLEPTHIKQVEVREGRVCIDKKGRIVGSFYRALGFKTGYQPINNARRLRKAYRRGGVNAMIDTYNFYRKPEIEKLNAKIN